MLYLANFAKTIFGWHSNWTRLAEATLWQQGLWNYSNFPRESSIEQQNPWLDTRTTDTQWRHKSKISEKLGRCGRQNMLPPYLKIWEWEWIFGHAVKTISSLGVRSPWMVPYEKMTRTNASHSLISNITMSIVFFYFLG